jgi:hypothetical protein
MDTLSSRSVSTDAFVLCRVTFTNSLTGTIPTEFGLLTALTMFDWSDNQIGGTIPTQFGRLSRLKEL